VTELLASRFDRIINENLPKRREMMDVLVGNALDADLFASKGNGIQTVLAKMGRISDFKGIYAFIENGKVVFLDESSYVTRRVIRQFKGNSKYQMKLAAAMTEIKKMSQPLYTMSDAIKEMEEMKVAFLDLPDNLERRITTLYLQCHYECIYNRLD